MLLAVIANNHKNGCHGSTIQDRDIQWKPSIPNFGQIFNLNMLEAILDDSHY